MSSAAFHFVPCSLPAIPHTGFVFWVVMNSEEHMGTERCKVKSSWELDLPIILVVCVGTSAPVSSLIQSQNKDPVLTQSVLH